jgi:hypothetical protein
MKTMTFYQIRINPAETEIRGNLWHAMWYLLRTLPQSISIQKKPQQPCLFTSPVAAILHLAGGSVWRKDVADGYFMRWSPAFEKMYSYDSQIQSLQRQYPAATEIVMNSLRLAEETNRFVSIRDFNSSAYRLFKLPPAVPYSSR